MNKKLLLKNVGIVMVIEAAFMVLPLIIALVCSESDWIWFLATIIPLGGIGLILSMLKVDKKQLFARGGHVFTGCAWVVMSLAGAVPFTLAGYMPYIDAVFETVSGFTTSGVTALTDIESLSYSMLFWRSLTHWIGGMGILVFMLAIVNASEGGSALFIMKSESPGPEVDKVSPKLRQTAKYLYYVYTALTLIEAACLVISGLSVYHAFIISFGTMATGGFSYSSQSLAMLTFAQQNIVTVFMLLAGVNFALFILALSGKPLKALKNEELICYAGIYVLACVMIAANLFTSGNFETLREAVHYTMFMTASVITTTGFSVTNANLFPLFSKTIILTIMFIGACAGSTAGGIKVSRVVIMVKSVKRHLRQIMHPRSVETIRFSGKSVSKQTEHGVMFYFCIFTVLFFGSLLIVSLDPAMEGDFLTAFSGVATTINNNGIAFGASSGSFSVFKWYTKVVFIIDMLIGRLEIIPIIVLFSNIISPAASLTKKIKRKTA